MKFYLDTEFIEAFHKPLFGKRRHFIDLISIGIRCEDGRELHLISSEYNYAKANSWVRNNVIAPLFAETVPKEQALPDSEYPGGTAYLVESNFHKYYGITNKEIAQKVLDFTNGDIFVVRQDVEFIGYYADYDWVLLCSLFGTMMDLPKGYPMYCVDLKQRLDEKVRHYAKIYKMPFDIMLEKLKLDKGYPAQENEHSAIADARWNEKLEKFIETI